MVRNYRRKTADRWSKADLITALKNILHNSVRINEAARTSGISRATLYRHYSRIKIVEGEVDLEQYQCRNCGGSPILTRVEEDILAKTILELRDNGHQVMGSDIKRICFEYCDANDVPNQFKRDQRMASDDWYYGFLKRHPECSSAKPENDVRGGSSATKSTKRKSGDVVAGGSDTQSVSTEELAPNTPETVTTGQVLTDLVGNYSTNNHNRRQTRKPLKRLSQISERSSVGEGIGDHTMKVVKPGKHIFEEMKCEGSEETDECDDVNDTNSSEEEQAFELSDLVALNETVEMKIEDVKEEAGNEVEDCCLHDIM